MSTAGGHALAPIGIAGWAVLGACVGIVMRCVANRLAARPLPFASGPPARTQQAEPSPSASTPTNQSPSQRTIMPRFAFEATTATVFVALAWHIGAEPQLLAYSWLAAVAVPLAALDLTSRRLPNQIILPSYPAVIALFGVSATATADLGGFLRSLAGMAILLAFHGTAYLLFPGGLGGGDVKLGGLIGLALGWSGWAAIPTGILLGWFGAAVWVLLARLFGHRRTSRPVSLAPFLLAGAVVALAIDALSPRL